MTGIRQKKAQNKEDDRMQQAELIDSTEKLKELENAANDGFARAQFNLAVCYEQGKWVELDMEKAVEWY